MITFMELITAHSYGVWRLRPPDKTQICFFCSNFFHSFFSPANLHDIDPTSALSVIGHSLGSYVSVLESAHLKHLATRIVTDVSTWVSKIFRFETVGSFKRRILEASRLYINSNELAQAFLQY